MHQQQRTRQIKKNNTHLIQPISSIQDYIFHNKKKHLYNIHNESRLTAHGKQFYRYNNIKQGKQRTPLLVHSWVV